MSAGKLEEEVSAVLADAQIELGVSRARCYAMGPTGDFRLAGAFGFPARSGPEDFLETSHPLVEWIHRHRRPAFANSPRDAGRRMGELMERDQYARMLTAPVYVGERMVGILELQDKLRGFFASEDLTAIDRLTARVASVLASYNGTSVAPDEPLAPEDADALFRPEASDSDVNFPPPPPLFSNAPETSFADVGRSTPPPLVLSKPIVETRPAAAPGAREDVVVRAFWSALLLSPEVEAVALSTWTRDSAEVKVGARRPFSESARTALLENLAPVLMKALPGARPPVHPRFAMEYPFGRGNEEVPGFAGIQTSVIASGARALLVSLLFHRPPGPEADEAFKQVHTGIRAAILQSISGERYRHSYRSLVRALLEPGVREYPQLKAHSYAVGALCRQFATALRLPADGIEQLTVAGLLHDVGIREVEVPYERLAGRRPLDLQEVALVRRHAVIGADILERIEFPYPVAPLVRHHHERYDGAGYPDGLSGERIPFGSRVLALAEVWDALTAPHSYRAPVSREAAIETIAGKAGTQFDPELARLFCDLMRTSGAARGAELNETRP